MNPRTFQRRHRFTRGLWLSTFVAARVSGALLPRSRGRAARGRASGVRTRCPKRQTLSRSPRRSEASRAMIDRTGPRGAAARLVAGEPARRGSYARAWVTVRARLDVRARGETMSEWQAGEWRCCSRAWRTSPRSASPSSPSPRDVRPIGPAIDSSRGHVARLHDIEERGAEIPDLRIADIDMKVAHGFGTLRPGRAARPRGLLHRPPTARCRRSWTTRGPPADLGEARRVPATPGRARPPLAAVTSTRWPCEPPAPPWDISAPAPASRRSASRRPLPL